MKMRLQLGSALVTWLAVAAEASASTEDAKPKGVKNIAIIGAGAAGASAAYYLRQYADEADVKVNITIFEKTNRIGGRTLTVNAFDDSFQPIELGASIFVAVNHILYNGTKSFNLSTGSNYRTASSDKDITAIWDGESFVYETTEGTAWWWDAGKLWWRYGTSPYRAVNLVKEVVGKFLKLYEQPYFPFRSLTARTYELGLIGITGVTGEQFLAQNKIDEKFSRHIIQAATRVNYASNLAYLHGLEAMVSFATDGAMSVTGGNWRIFEEMVKNSGATIYQNTSVSSIAFAKEKTSSSSSPKYKISTTSAGSSSTESEAVGTAFDDVIIASPWQFSNIEAGEGVIKHHIEEIPYTKLHVTLFASPFKLHPEFFKLPPGSTAPSNVYTTLAEGEKAKQGAEGVGKTGFYSVSTLRTALNPKTLKTEFVYKIFSAKPVTPQFLSDLLGVKVPKTFTAVAETEGNGGGDDEDTKVDPISWYYPHWFYSYPIELPRVTFQDPILGSGLYYTSGIESFISTMETSALMGMNVARLIVDDAAGISREDISATMSEEDLGLQKIKVELVVEELGEL